MEQIKVRQQSQWSSSLLSNFPAFSGSEDCEIGPIAAAGKDSSRLCLLYTHVTFFFWSIGSDYLIFAPYSFFPFPFQEISPYDTVKVQFFHHRVASIFDLIDRETMARTVATSSSCLRGLQISYQPKKRLLIRSWPSFSRTVWKTVWSKQLNCSNHRWWAKLDWVKKRSRRCYCSWTACFARDGDGRSLHLLQVPPADFAKWRCAARRAPPPPTWRGQRLRTAGSSSARRPAGAPLMFYNDQRAAEQMVWFSKSAASPPFSLPGTMQTTDIL